MPRISHDLFGMAASQMLAGTCHGMLRVWFAAGENILLTLPFLLT